MASKKTDKTENITPIGRVLTRLEEPKNITRMIIGLAGFCALLFVADFFHLRHGKFEAENFIGFYGFFGFIAFAFIIFSTKVLAVLIGRKENYYAPNAVDAEDYPAEELDIKEHGDV